MRPGSALLLAGLLSGPLSFFGGARRLAHHGEKQFRAGKLTEAERSFGEASRREPQDPLWQYDLGTVRAGAEGGDAARRELQAAVGRGDSSVAAAASYQLGTLDLQEKKYGEAVRALRRALELDPARADAKRNLEIALRRSQSPPPPRGGAGGAPPRRPAPAKARTEPDREFENRAGMTRAQADALLRSLDDEQRQREHVADRFSGRDW